MTALSLNIGTDGPATVLSFPDLDLTGYTLALKVAGGGTSESYETGGNGLSVSVDGGDSTVTWERTVAQSKKFGSTATFDLFATAPGGVKSKLAAGTIRFAGVGQIVDAPPQSVEVPGIQGPPGPSIYAEEWAQSADPISVAAGGDGVNDRSSKWWAEASQTAQETVEGIYDAVTAAPVTIADSTYTLLSGDLGKTLRFSAACVVTLPAGLPAGWWCVLRRVGSGAVSWALGGSATKHEYPAGVSSAIAAQWADVVVSVDSNAGSAAVYVINGAIA